MSYQVEGRASDGWFMNGRGRSSSRWRTSLVVALVACVVPPVAQGTPRSGRRRQASTSPPLRLRRLRRPDRKHDDDPFDELASGTVDHCALDDRMAADVQWPLQWPPAVPECTRPPFRFTVPEPWFASIPNAAIGQQCVFSGLNEVLTTVDRPAADHPGFYRSGIMELDGFAIAIAVIDPRD